MTAMMVNRKEKYFLTSLKGVSLTAKKPVNVKMRVSRSMQIPALCGGKAAENLTYKKA